MDPASSTRIYSAPFDSYVGFWLPSGIYLSALLLTETRLWPWLFLVAFPVTFVSDMIHLNSLWRSVGFFFGNSVESLTGAYLIRRLVAARPSLLNIREFLGFLAYGAFIAPAVGATIGAAVILISGGKYAFGVPRLTWWASESIGIILVTPVLLTSLAPDLPTLVPRLNARRAAEMIAMFSLISVTVWAVAIQEPVIASTTKYALLPLLLWQGSGSASGAQRSPTCCLGSSLDTLPHM